MKTKIILSFEVDTDEYHSVKPTEHSVKELVKAMINGHADFPEKIDIDVTET